MKKRISLIVLLLVMALIALFLKKYASEFHRILEISTNYLIILSILILCTIFCNALKIKVLTDSYSLKLKIKEWVGLSVITTMGNYLTPFRGGAGARAIYLKKKHKFPYILFLTTLGATYIISFFVYGLLGIIAISRTRESSLFNLPLFLFFIALFLIMASIILFSPSLKNTKNKFINYFIKIVNEWKVMKKNYKLISNLMIIDTALCLIMASRLYFSFHALAYDVSFLSCLLIVPLAMISSLITITPAAIGIREGAIALSSKLIGFSIAAGAYASALDRIVSMAWVFVLGPIFSYILAKK